MGPIVKLPAAEQPGPGLSGYVFPIDTREAPFGLIVFTVAPGASTEAHSHAVHEYWMVTAGRGQLRYDGDAHAVTAGDLLYFEPHKTHQIVNDSDEALAVVSIDWHGQEP